MLASGTPAGWWGGAAVCMVWMVAGGEGRHPPLFFSTVLAQRTKATPAAEGIPA